MKNIRKYFMITVFFITILIFDIIVSKETINKYIHPDYDAEYSEIENRMYSKFKELKNFDLSRFFNSNVIQEDFEQSLADNFIFSEDIRYFFKSDFKLIKYSKLPKKICKNNYVRVDGDYGVYDCDDSLVYYPYSKNKFYLQLQKNLKDYDSINKNIDTYYYFVPSSYSFDFSNNTSVVDVEEEMKKNFKNPYTYSSLNVSDYNSYKKYFFKTDHHWNYKGSYQGYKDIINMIYEQDDINEPSSEISFKNSNFYGTLSIVSGVREFKEPFSVYEFSLNEYDQKIIGTYGVPNSNVYKFPELYSDPFLYHYYQYYGDDYSLVKYNFYNPDKDNILIISDSYIKSNRELIASHFNETHILNLNEYISDFEKNFDIKKYVQENNINKVLFLCDLWILSGNNFDIEWR